MFTTYIQDRNYIDWNITPHSPLQENPSQYKLFHEDSFDIEGEKVVLKSSPIRTTINIPGIIILEKNRSYGRTNNNKRLFYKCIPHNLLYPSFLIPYEIPIGFNKNFRNKFVTFRFDSWNDKHPHGILSQTIGDIDDLNAFYEYQLYCRGLHQPITPAIKQCKQIFQKRTRDEWIEYILSEPARFGNILQDDTKYIFSIDPEDCTDRDDSLSIVQISETSYKVTVYIANVWIWIEAFDLWDSIGQRISTIYLPDKKRSMLPSIVSEDCCSLDAGKRCFVIAADFYVENNVIKSVSNPVQKIITIHKQFHYDDSKLYHYSSYSTLETITKQLDHSVQDSHDTVSYWMTKMNIAAAEWLMKHQCGIFRITQSREKSVTTNIHTTMNSFIRIWEQKLSGKYIVYKPDEVFYHDSMQVNGYVHFTSPIRRMIDVINHMYWVSASIEFSNTAKTFLEKFQKNITEINDTMNRIKKVQNECSILCQVMNEPDILNKSYEALVLEQLSDRIYSVYIQELKWIAKVYSDTYLDKYSSVSCTIYIFSKEEQLRKKIRVKLL